MATQEDRRAAQLWYEFHRSFQTGLGADPDESRADRRRRVKQLEKDPEKWFAYYFKKYYKAEAASFHKKATKRVIEHPEWFEVRARSRELAKSVRTMMEVCYLVMTGRKKTIILTSNSKDNAERLLAPYRAFFESNERLIADYGPQANPGRWTESEFTTRGGAAFRAVGAQQSPRGSRNEELRPDVLLVDDFDTDEECLNPDVLNKKWDWWERALYPTRSVSTPLLVIFCGNIIAEDCCIVRAQEHANHTDIINIRMVDINRPAGKEDYEAGTSVWPQKNSEEHIDTVLAPISMRAALGEYFNTPTSEGGTFGDIAWGKCPPLSQFPFLMAYADPATSNRTKKTSCTKALVLLGFAAGKFYVINCRIDNATTDTFVQWFYELDDYTAGRSQVYYYIENNSLQNPFFEQVLLPRFTERGRKDGHRIGVVGDTRNKGDKFSRIEGALEPLVRSGQLVFNAAEATNPHMRRLQEQFRMVNPRLSAPCDGPDAVEGAVFLIREKLSETSGRMRFIARGANPKKY